MSTESRPRTIRVNNSSLAGAFWSAGWMFTIAFAKLIWWKSLLALIIWPWYLALTVR